MHSWHNHLYWNGTNCNATTEEELKKCRVKIKSQVSFVYFFDVTEYMYTKLLCLSLNVCQWYKNVYVFSN
jgi:hypothetical protein